MFNNNVRLTSDRLRGTFPAAGCMVICYHGVIEQYTDPFMERNFLTLEEFRNQCVHLKQYRIVSLPELEYELTRGIWEAITIAITVDDGHRNNWLVQDILGELGLPWAAFIPTKGIESTVWTTELALLLLHGQASEIHLLGRAWPLTNRPEREKTYDLLRKCLKQQTAEIRIQTMHELRSQFPAGETEHLLERFPSMSSLSWQDVITLKNEGCIIGSHGVSHELHHQHQTPGTRAFELQASKQKLETILADECRYFAFPNGDYAEESPLEVQAAGYKLAFTVEPKLTSNHTNPFLIPRISPFILRAILGSSCVFA